MGGINRKALLIAGLWLAAYCGAFVAYGLTEPSGSGFTRGTNRAGAFLLWQLAASVLAFVLWRHTRNLTISTPAKWVLRAPVVITVLQLAVLVGLILFGVLSAQQGL
ncbi:MAG: hypothetical protein AB8B88_10185 [Devosiaceae bacterium]